MKNAYLCASMAFERECQFMPDLTGPGCPQFLSLSFGADEELTPSKETVCERERVIVISNLVQLFLYYLIRSVIYNDYITVL